MNPAGAVVVVTGGGSGIGAALARALARARAATVVGCGRGAGGLVWPRLSLGGRGRGTAAALPRARGRAEAPTVVVCDRDAAAAQAVADGIAAEHGVPALAFPADVSQEAQTLALVEAAERRFGPIGLFCANAGVTAHGGVELPNAQWERLWQVNVMAHVHAARALVPRMLARGRGHLLLTASAAGLLSQFDAAYAVTKHAAVALAEWLAITHGGRGIGISCLCPGAVDTPLFRAESATRRALMGAQPLTPEAVAEATLQGLREDRFLILPQPEIAALVQRKHADPERWLRGMRGLHAQAGEATTP